MKRLYAAARMLSMAAGLCIAAAPAYAAEEVARVLILNALDPYGPAYLRIEATMRATLAEETTRRIFLYSEQLDAQRFPQEELEPEILAFLTKKYRNVHIDVVVAVSRIALEFFQRHGEQLWPDARLVFYDLPGGTDTSTLPPNAIGFLARDDLAGTVDLARRLQPNARRILVISGTAPVDLQLEQRARQVVPTVAGEAAVEFLSGWPLPELVNRVAGESADTIVLYLAQFRDRDGGHYTFRESLRAISSASAAPVYSVYESAIGFGSVAGSTEFLEDGGKLVGQLVRNAAAGRSPEPGKAWFTVPSRCVADAHEMQRWSLDPRRLPAGCELRFTDPPSIWRHYWWQIVVGLAVIVAQAMLIAMLIVQRRQRRIAELEVQHQRTELAHASRLATLGELSASIAHEVNQPLGAISGNVDAVELLLDADPPKLQDARRVLNDLKEANQRASDVVLRIRKLLRKRELEFEPYDVNGAASDIIRLLETDAARRGVEIRTEFGPLPVVNGDRVHFQQVLLNLLMNGMEAMAATPVGRRHLTLRTGRNADGDVEIAVTDTGRGIDPSDLPRLFDSFFTKKTDGMGLGLALCRSIVQAHGGRIWVQNNPGGGATFAFALPINADQRVQGGALQPTPRSRA